MRFRPVVLCILDGYGMASPAPGNAISRARHPRIDALLRGPHAQLDASGRSVGLPEGVMGNSEVGHLTIGAGFAQRQDFVRINDDIANGAFFRNPVLVAACAQARERGVALHLMGLVSDGGVHADYRHLIALLELARAEGVSRVFVHAFLDGRDMPPRSAPPLLDAVRQAMARFGAGAYATVSGRYYAMDRDKRWDRTERAYDAIVLGAGPATADVTGAVDRCYGDVACRDELMVPNVIVSRDKPLGTLTDRESVVFFNFRPDRARQLTWALMQPDFPGFARKRWPRDLYFVSMTEYKVELPDVHVAYAPQPVRSVAEILSEHGLRQFHCAETEKYAHVTYFFNGGREPPFPGEDRELVPSPKVKTYDLKPEMSAREVADRTAAAITSGSYDFVVVNFANPDMVGHTGVIAATIKAVEVTDACVGRLLDATREAGGAFVLTADHGNAEALLDVNGRMLTQHSTNPVPVAYAAPDAEHVQLRDGTLADIAPTLLELFGLPVPDGMSGRSLLVRKHEHARS
ncbi:MAG TPA: 2,3-bisphosphoglycerate-independent phosphoglycerate mutase [Candidatus Limnocylindria bacterium]|nr:2,3-bisphosphoglycerate-independent phosphoglycerate mutase [Candidatus Limnocylindria bacterium]